MKMITFYICAFGLLFSVTIVMTSSNKLGNKNINYTICLAENNVSDEDIFTEQDIADNVHKQPENRERIRKNGCVFYCLYEGLGVANGLKYDLEKAVLSSEFFKCWNNGKDLTDKCLKAFILMECSIKDKNSFENK